MRHVMLSKDSFLYVGDCKIHKDTHMHLQHLFLYPHAYNHMHTAYACAGLGSA
jgi:hypothetical protein